MLSADDNARTRAPSDARVRDLVVVVLLVVAAVAAIEWGFRQRGILPSQRDTVRLWGTQRVGVEDADHPVVFMGSSRIQHAIRPSTLEEVFVDRDFFQLAVVGSAPFSLLDRLADDESFDGVVICEFYPTYFFGSEQANSGLLESWLVSFDARSWIDDIESQLRVQAKDRLVLGNVETRPTMILYNLITRRDLPNPAHIRIHGDRWQEADFSNYEPSKWTDDAKYRLDDAELAQRIRHFRSQVKKIRDRGGNVVVLRPPTSGDVRRQERELYPRATHFDRFVEAVGVEAVHFEDNEAMRHFVCPDGRHLAGDDARRFTEFLASELERRSLL